MLGGSVVLALLVYLAGHLALWAARHLAAAKPYRRSMQHVQALGRSVQAAAGSLQRRLSGGPGSGKSLGAGASSDSGEDPGACLETREAGSSACTDDQVRLLLTETQQALRQHLERIERVLAGRQAALPV